MRLETGKYIGKLVGNGVAVTEKGTPYLYLTFLIDQVRRDGQWDCMETEETRDIRFFLSDAAIEYAERDLRSLGFSGDYENPTFSEKLYEGVELECGSRIYDGKTFEDWKIAGLGGAAEKKPADKNLLKTLNAKWKSHNGKFTESPAQNRLNETDQARLDKARQAVSRKPTAPVATVATEAEPEYGPKLDDDIPF